MLRLNGGGVVPALLAIKALDKLNRKDIAVFTMELE